VKSVSRTLKTPGANRLRDAQAALESAVLAAYGTKDSEDTLAFRLRLNLDLAAKESAGESRERRQCCRRQRPARRGLKRIWSRG
jgi:hypothetical protein